MNKLKSAATAERRSQGIKLHDPADFEGMRKAGKLAAEVLDFIAPYVKPGVTTEHWTSCAMTSLSTMEPFRRRSIIAVFPNPSAHRSIMWCAMVFPARNR